ncbi:hypothetical protein BJY01DRAFT_146231 [Aspergillus pseudoustus]|uniref:SRR1-like domain-containing protein n=1 Tax=Aspergillus pseudoustus TaxID=1810923 RepID=A0ABR4KA96_9EURO
MPHTSRRKKHPSQQHKRLEVTDSSGWTHVTTSGNAGRLNNRFRDQKSTPSDVAISESSNQAKEEGEEVVEPPLSPAEAPASVTLSQLERQLKESRRRWEDSETWASAQGALRRALPRATSLEGEGYDDVSIVCVGLGSPSGFLRGGWVDRRSVSMHQLAALTSVMELLEKQTPNRDVKVYAQDPVFNSYDRALLELLNITVLEHPGAFERVSSRALLFCPGAERRHLELLLAHNPAIVFGGPLEDIDSDTVTGYVRARDSVQLPLFEEQEHAFWRMRVYYTPSERG